MLGQDMVIPPEVLRNAHGLAIITQLKAGFLFSGRAGSGVIVARLSDGSWSAPSAIVTAGAGVGGQIGAELTDFVFILNNQAAVDTFSHAGSITLGGNVSLAAGPLGRNAEVAGSASRSSVAAIFSYSKTKGLFAGVSLEGSVLVERREANRKFYGSSSCTARQILSGRVEPPPECDVLFRVLESRAFRGVRGNYDDDDFYDDIPDSFSETDSYERPSRGSSRRVANNRDYDDEDDDRDFGRSGSTRSSARVRSGSRSENSWEDDFYDRPNLSRNGTNSSRTRNQDDDYYDRSGSIRSGTSSSRVRNQDDDDVDRLSGQLGRTGFRSKYSDNPSGNSPGRPKAPKPRWQDDAGGNSSNRFDDNDDDDYEAYSRSRSNSTRSRNSQGREYSRGGGSDAPAKYDADRQALRTREAESRSEATSVAGEKAVALYSFGGEQSGDLDFRKGDIITIVQKSDSKDDWWTGKRGGKQGIFPANYVELV